MKDFDTSSVFSDFALAGYYLALRVGFAFPVFEQNKLPTEWVKIYTSQGFMLHDPVMKWLYTNTGAVRWSEISQDDPLGVLGLASTYSLRYGVAISCVDNDQTGQRSFGSFARTDREFTDEEIARLSEEIIRLHIATKPPSNLTRAEKEVLAMVKNGMLLKQMAAELGVSQGAIKQRLKNAKLKLNANNSAQAATKAMEFGLI